jgi:hypothetical protein
MALRKPVVVVNGQLQQLQAGDTLDAPQSGGDQIILTNDEATPVVIGAPVYMDAVSGFKKAQANAAGHQERDWSRRQVAEHHERDRRGRCRRTAFSQRPRRSGTRSRADTGGLTFNSVYYLDPATAGKLTKTAPTTVGQYVMPIGLALSTTDLQITISTGQDVLL